MKYENKATAYCVMISNSARQKISDCFGFHIWKKEKSFYFSSTKAGIAFSTKSTISCLPEMLCDVATSPCPHQAWDRKINHIHWEDQVCPVKQPGGGVIQIHIP